MPDSFIQIKPEGIDKIKAAFNKFPREIAQYLSAAGKEAASRVIFPTVGIKRYPPKKYFSREAAYGKPFFSDKQRRAFFAGLKDGSVDVPYRRGRSASSERYGTQWYANRKGAGTEIGNRASYAPLLGGDKQSRMAKMIGWRKLTDVVDEKMEDITKVYQAWVDKLISKLGL